MGEIAVITGFAAGLGTAMAEILLSQGFRVAGLSRTGRNLDTENDNFRPYQCDVGDAVSLADTFQAIREDLGNPSLLVHNAAKLLLRDFTEINLEEFEAVIRTAVTGGFLCTQEVLPEMLAAERGVIIFTGATASIKGGPKSGAFAAAKFAQRGMAQSLARAYGPRGVHVIHTIIDGVIWGDRAENEFGMDETACMSAEDIAETYWQLIAQKPTSWTHEIDLRPAQERF